ncbi:MAG: hypothetical protein ABI042_15630 [Verrucomicrobiota bacterium]
MHDYKQLTSLLGSKSLSFGNNHDSQIRTVTINYANPVTQIR